MSMMHFYEGTASYAYSYVYYSYTAGELRYEGLLPAKWTPGFLVVNTVKVCCHWDLNRRTPTYKSGNTHFTN